MSVVFPIYSDPRFRISTAVGGETSFSVPFPFQDNADIAIVRFDDADDVVGTVLAQGAHYTLTGAGNPAGGTATLVDPAVAGQRYMRMGQAIVDRILSVVRDGRFKSSAIDSDLDRFIIIALELLRDQRRAWHSPYGEQGGLIRRGAAGTVAMFDDEGDLVEGPDGGDIEASQGYAAQALASRLLAEAAANRAETALNTLSFVLHFKTIAAMQADTTLSYSAGPGKRVVAADDNIWAQGFRYVVAASGAVNHQLVTAGGVKLYQGEPTTVATNGNYTATIQDQGRMISVSAAAGARTVSLPAAAAVGNGFRIIVQKSDASGNAVTIDPAGSELINGETAFVLVLKGQSAALACDGTSWRVMAGTEVFETGVTATGEYLKLANGWMECSLYIPYTGVATASADGSIFKSPPITPGVFPKPFITTPTVTVSGKPGGVNGWAECAVSHTQTEWGTYRTVAAETDANAGGNISLRATGRWAGASGGVATLILKNGSADESFIVGKRGSDTIVRGFRGWNAQPMVQYGANQYPVLTFTSDIINGTLFRPMNDDNAPYLVGAPTVAHRGGLHTFFCSRLNATAHGRTVAAIGQTVTSGGFTFVILAIMSVNQLLVMRVDSDVAAPTGAYVYAAGPGVTTGFTASASNWEPFYPGMVADRTVALEVDGVPIAATTGLFTFSESVVFTETYSSLDRSEVIDWFIAHGAGGSLAVTGDPLFTVTIRYRFDFEGNCTIEQLPFEAEASPSLTINRLYGVQMQNGGVTAWYIPKTTSFVQDATTYDFAMIETTVTPATEVILDDSKTLAGGLYLDRAIGFNGNNGLAMGFLPLEIAEPVVRRSTYVTAGNTGMSLATSGKLYGSVISKGVHTVPPNTQRRFLAYRNPVVRGADRTAAYAVRSSLGDFFYADWHDKAFTDSLDIPADFVGRAYEVLEKSANVSAADGTFAGTMGVTVNAAGSYGYMVLRLL